MADRRANLALLSLALSLGCGDDVETVPPPSIGGPCDVHTDCESRLICSAGTCQREGSRALGQPCSATRDCSETLFCSIVGLCGLAGGGEEGAMCQGSEDCKRGLECERTGFSGECSARSGDHDLGEPCGSHDECLPGLYCSDSGTCRPPNQVFVPFEGVACEEREETFGVYFEVPRMLAPPADFFRLPFPNDARVSVDGDLDMTDFPRPGRGILGIDLVDRYVDALVEDFAGFSSIGAVYFRFKQELDFNSATPQAVHFVDVTKDAREFGTDRARQWSYTTGRGLYHCPDIFIVRNDPGQPLLPRHTYAVYLTTELRNADGARPEQDADFAQLLGDGEPSDGALGRAWRTYEPFRAYLFDQNIDPDAIAAAAVFTVQPTISRAQRLAAAVTGTPPPTLKDLTVCGDGAVSPCDDGGVRKCGTPKESFYEVHGRMSVPIFQRGEAPYLLPENGGAIEDLGGIPEVVRTEDVCFALSIPKRGAMPPDGWPLVVYAHGTGGSMLSAINNDVARALAMSPSPTAVLTLDGVVHGDRRNGVDVDPEQLMFNVMNPKAARDNHLQGMVDVLHAVRVANLDPVELPTTGTIAFDRNKVYFFGHSQGSNVGIPAVGLTNAVSSAVLSGAGAFLTEALMNKTNPVSAKAALSAILGEEVTASHPLMTVMQTYFDPVDTLNFAPLLLTRPPEGVRSKNIFMTYGLGDTYSPPSALSAMASSAGLPVAEPVLEDLMTGVVERPVSLNRQDTGDGIPRTAAVFQYAPGDYDGHFVANRSSSAVSNWVSFLSSHTTTATAAVP